MHHIPVPVGKFLRPVQCLHQLPSLLSRHHNATNSAVNVNLTRFFSLSARPATTPTIPYSACTHSSTSSRCLHCQLRSFHSFRVLLTESNSAAQSNSSSHSSSSSSANAEQLDRVNRIVHPENFTTRTSPDGRIIRPAESSSTGGRSRPHRITVFLAGATLFGFVFATYFYSIHVVTSANDTFESSEVEVIRKEIEEEAQRYEMRRLLLEQQGITKK